MELELLKNNNLDVTADNIKNASTIVNEAFNNSVEKELNNMNLEEGILSKIKKGFEKLNIKEVVSKSIDTAMKTTLKTVARC